MSDIFTEYPETGRAENERLRSTIDRLQAELAAKDARIAELEAIECPVQINIDEKAKMRIDELTAELRAARAEAESDSLRATIIKLTFEATGKVLAAEAEVTKKHLELCEYQTQLDAISTALERAEAALEPFSSIYVGEMDDDDIIAVKVKHVRKARAALAQTDGSL